MDSLIVQARFTEARELVHYTAESHLQSSVNLSMELLNSERTTHLKISSSEISITMKLLMRTCILMLAVQLWLVPPQAQ